MNDDRLLRQMQRGQQEALEALMEKYRRYVYTVVANVLGGSANPYDAEELTADTFYAVWDHADRIRPGGLKGYLGAAARNRAKDFLRGRRELPMDLDTVELSEQAESPEDSAIREERARAVKKALSRMRPRDREIFLRYYYYLQTAEEIAGRLDMPAATVRSRLSRGRKKLKEILSQEGFS